MRDSGDVIVADDQIVFRCRACGGGVRVAGRRYLPEACSDCGATTWDEDGVCASGHCDAVRRPGVRGRGHCPVCGYSVWVSVASVTYAA